MKKIYFLPVIVLIVVFLSCDKDETMVSYDLNFSRIEYDKTNSSVEIKEVLVRYNEILAYDSAQYVFQLDKPAWVRMKSKITPIYPDPNFGFGVTVDNELLYKVAYVPGYHSYSYPEVIKFAAIEPDLIHLYYGHYEGIENVNDDKVIEILSKDGKLKTIDLEVE